MAADEELALKEKRAQSKENAFLVSFEDDDPERPINWKRRKKVWVTLICSLITFVVSFNSSIFSSDIVALSEYFDISQEVIILGITVYVLGFAFGPVLFGPLSELYGRNLGMLPAFLVFILFNLCTGLGQNVQTIIIGRFFSGLFGAAPLAVVAGNLADIWPTRQRGVAIAVYTAAVYMGPLLGPIVGGFTVASSLGFRWTAWFVIMFAGAVFLVAVFTLPETHAPTLLKRKAKQLRKDTKVDKYHTAEEAKTVSIMDIIRSRLVMPIVLLATELPLMLMTIYLSFVYGITYLILVAYPVEFEENRGYPLGVGDLPFLGVAVGIIIGLIIAVADTPRFIRKLEISKGKPIPKERLPTMMIGGILLVIGLFWFGWTSYPHASWIPPTLAGMAIGSGLFLIFLQALNYITDTYTRVAASAVAGNAFVRAMLAAGFPLFGGQMFRNLGVDWASSTLGFISLVLVPIPFVFYFFDEWVRGKSRYAKEDGKLMCTPSQLKEKQNNEVESPLDRRRGCRSSAQTNEAEVWHERNMRKLSRYLSDSE
ncbi:hypothetical protein PROFUN_08430 [Planoprotostelium fungivorum]|uniref:Major facilitator superfamily (MFS) profile domain-containing protein n=1 Tax=Planoprotostelium fungivorum TaxID=1890364 RepID=A0A2P6NJV6_9EUKA|nr:hypothetical protein PROFUN_08430 [Planoprotostelium fungivorum]